MTWRVGYPVASSHRVDGIMSVPSLVKHASVTFGIELVELMEIKPSVKKGLAAAKVRAVEEQQHWRNTVNTLSLIGLVFMMNMLEVVDV
jgi:hypothetical protein